MVRNIQHFIWERIVFLRYGCANNGHGRLNNNRQHLYKTKEIARVLGVHINTVFKVSNKWKRNGFALPLDGRAHNSGHSKYTLSNAGRY